MSVYYRNRHKIIKLGASVVVSYFSTTGYNFSKPLSSLAKIRSQDSWGCQQWLMLPDENAVLTICTPTFHSGVLSTCTSPRGQDCPVNRESVCRTTSIKGRVELLYIVCLWIYHNYFSIQIENDDISAATLAIIRKHKKDLKWYKTKECAHERFPWTFIVVDVGIFCVYVFGVLHACMNTTDQSSSLL